MATETEVQNRIQQRVNDRGHRENYLSGIHMSTDDLKWIHHNKHTTKNVSGPNERSEDVLTLPHYPRPVEFHASRIAHVTTEAGLDGILDCNGFRGGERTGFLWWGLVISQEEIKSAEQRYLENLFPDRSPEERERQEPFLHHFTTSPVFKEESRYGNFRFSFSLADVLQEYSTQFCRGQKPVFRVYETIVYKQEIMYSVLIHSPDVHDYDDYPVLGDNDDGVCAYRDGEIIWRAQAIPATHAFRLIENREEKQVLVEGVWRRFYMWDHVTLAFHTPVDKTLKFPTDTMLEVLTACDGAYPPVNSSLIGKTQAEEIIRYRRHNFGCYHGHNLDLGNVPTMSCNHQSHPRHY